MRRWAEGMVREARGLRHRERERGVHANGDGVRVPRRRRVRVMGEGLG